MIGGFRVEETTSEKNPTEEVVAEQPKQEKKPEPIDLITDEDGNFIGGIGNEGKQVETAGSIVHKGFQSDDERQQMVQYAYKLGGIDFVKMIECENGNWNIKAVGDSGKAFGLCQINTNYHKLPEGYKENWRIQVETCYEKWKGGTKFYGPSRIVKGQKCSSYVSSRFILN